MSGIVGIINLDGQPVAQELLESLTASLSFRGPDHQSVWHDGPVGFGHALLRTTFESAHEQQPLSLDGRVWITADARIDGRAELIRQLAGRGCTGLKNPTDPELILQAYQVWGEDCLRHLIGDFAFAIWDGPGHKLFAARDHLGVKPFYYAELGRSLLCSNTLNCLRRHPGVSGRLNDLVIADFLLFEYNRDPATTSFADIKRLPAAHCLTWRQRGGVHVRRYWSLPADGPVRYPRQRDYVERFQELLKEAVADRLRTDQVGAFMSGGLDSTLVTALAKELLAARSAAFDLQCYAVVYDRLIPDEERHYAGVAARHLQIPIEFLPMDDYGLFDRHAELRRPEPYHNLQEAATTDFLTLAASRSRVLLTGEGGDEILSQSKSYLYKLARGLRLATLAAGIGRSVFIYGHLPQVGFKSLLGRWRRGQRQPEAELPAWVNPDFAARLNLRERWQQSEQVTTPSHPVRPEAGKILDDPYLQEVLEKQYDAGSIGLPVEVRHPLLDVRLVGFALSLPPLPWCVDKIMLRELARGRLPEIIRRRSKTPLTDCPELARAQQPGARWLDTFAPCEELAAYVRRDAVPPVSAATDSGRLWLNLRPVSLNYWLQNS
jgi:asparagine synthase (glutamine-hydrolysing)